MLSSTRRTIATKLTKFVWLCLGSFVVVVDVVGRSGRVQNKKKKHLIFLFFHRRHHHDHDHEETHSRKSESNHKSNIILSKLAKNNIRKKFRYIVSLFIFLTIIYTFIRQNQ